MDGQEICRWKTSKVSQIAALQSFWTIRTPRHVGHHTGFHMMRRKSNTLFDGQPHSTAWQTDSGQDRGCMSKKEEVAQEVSTSKHVFWTTIDDFVDCHHEAPTSQMDESDERALPNPLQNVDVMRQTRSNTDTLSDLTITDVWTDGKGNVLSEDPIGTARVLIGRPGQGTWSTNEDPTVHGSELEMARHEDNTDKMNQKENVKWHSSKNWPQKHRTLDWKRGIFGVKTR